MQRVSHTVIIVALVLGLVNFPVWAAEKYGVTLDQFSKAKAFYDDPRPWIATDLNPKNIMPPETYGKMTYDIEAMKQIWAEIVGFKAPDVVGKVAPEIKPGKYTYRDKEKYPGLKDLMIPIHYEQFNPGMPPHAGNFPEIEIVPTNQYYFALPIAEANKKYMGMVKQDDQGYLIPETYVAGKPFPRPSGEFKAQQVMYNWEKRYIGSDSYYLLQTYRGYDKNLKEDYDATAKYWLLRTCGRVFFPPYGWYDERAQNRGEKSSMLMSILGPRDQYGNVITSTKFTAPDNFDQILIYISTLRRVRKLSGSDTQDGAVGAEII